MAKLQAGTIVMLEDLGKEFAAGTGCILLTVTLRQTVSGWQMIVKRLSNSKVKEILFLDAWTVNELLEMLFNVVYHGSNSTDWKPDKF